MSSGRRIVVEKYDVLLVDGVEVDGEILKSIVDTGKRLLWTFIKNESGDICPIALDETRVIWLTDSDLQRKELPNAV